MHVRALILATVITAMSSTTAIAYTDKELGILIEDCMTSLAIQRQFNRNRLIIYRDITLRTGDNCHDLIRLHAVKPKGQSYLKEWDKKMACAHLGQDLINDNGGLQAMPLPDHLQKQLLETVIDGETCADINARNKR